MGFKELMESKKKWNSWSYISWAKACKTTSTIIYCPHLCDRFPDPGWWLCESDPDLHRCGRWSEGWVSSSWGNSSLSRLPLLPCPDLSFPVVLSAQRVQSNPKQSPSAPPFPSLVVSIAAVLRCHCGEREWPAWVELGWLTESWNPIVATDVSPFCHPQLPTPCLPWHQGQNEQTQTVNPSCITFIAANTETAVIVFPDLMEK